MANPTTDYKFCQGQADIEQLAHKIWSKNKIWMSYSQAYIKAVRLLGSVQ